MYANCSAQRQHVMWSQVLSVTILINAVAAASSDTRATDVPAELFFPLSLTAPSLCMMLSKVSSDCTESVML